MGYFYIAMTIVFTVYGQLILKREVDIYFTQEAAEQLNHIHLIKFLVRPLVISGFVAAFVAALSWIGALSRFELSFAYPFTSLSYVFVLALSALILGEGLDGYRVAGVLAICGGLILIGVGGK